MMQGGLVALVVIVCPLLWIMTIVPLMASHCIGAVRTLLVVGAMIVCMAPAYGENDGAAPLTSAKYVWQSVKIVDGGVMPGIYIHPAVPGLMYIRANVGGAYRWDSTKAIWVPLLDWLGGARSDWNLTGVESIALDPTDQIGRASCRERV